MSLIHDAGRSNVEERKIHRYSGVIISNITQPQLFCRCLQEILLPYANHLLLFSYEAVPRSIVQLSVYQCPSLPTFAINPNLQCVFWLLREPRKNPSNCIFEMKNPSDSFVETAWEPLQPVRQTEHIDHALPDSTDCSEQGSPCTPPFNPQGMPCGKTHAGEVERRKEKYEKASSPPSPGFSGKSGSDSRRSRRSGQQRNTRSYGCGSDTDDGHDRRSIRRERRPEQPPSQPPKASSSSAENFIELCVQRFSRRRAKPKQSDNTANTQICRFLVPSGQKPMMRCLSIWIVLKWLQLKTSDPKTPT